MITLALILLVAQEGSPELSATADRHKLMVGEELVYTVRAVSTSQESMSVQVGSVSGFEVVSRTERREVSFAPVARSSVLELRLRALRAGTFQLGPVEAHQGGEVVTIPGVSIVVSESRGAVAAAVNPRVATLLRRARPPSPAGEVGLTVHLSADTVLVGQQVDVVTAAWFPRDLRLRLRRPPTLQPPKVDGLWSYPQPAPVGIAASRRVGRDWYDLFVSHEVVFPLTPGTFVLEPASLRYSVPLALQFFSQEERLSLKSATPVLVVRPLPVDGQPAGFQGAVGSKLEIGWHLPQASGRVGDPLPVEFTVTGLGNVALWPDPSPAWTDDVRVYRDRVEEHLESEAGRIGGSKTFEYLLVPTEPGMLTIPAVRYPFYDVDAGRYRVLEVEPKALRIAPGDESLAARGLPPPLLADGGPSFSYRLETLPWIVWLVVFGAPPLVYLAALLMPRRRQARPARGVPSDLRSAELAFERLIRLYVPDLEEHVGSELVSALTVAGLEHSMAERVGVLRQRLMLARYGPEAGDGQQQALIVEIRDIVAHLATIPQSTLRHRAVTVGIAALLATSGTAWSQVASPSELYQAGALRLAADGFQREVELAPGVVARWYNLGAAHYRLGHDWQAAAAWHRALELAPRNRHVRRARALVPPPDAASDRRLMVPPVTAGELLLLAVVFWIPGWVGLMRSRRFQRRWVVLLLLSAGSVAGAGAVAWWRQRPRAIVLADTPLRVSPHERAPAVAPGPAGTVVWLGRRWGPWVLVRAPGDSEGWLPREAVATP